MYKGVERPPPNTMGGMLHYVVQAMIYVNFVKHKMYDFIWKIYVWFQIVVNMKVDKMAGENMKSPSYGNTIKYSIVIFTIYVITLFCYLLLWVSKLCISLTNNLASMEEKLCNPIIPKQYKYSPPFYFKVFHQ